ncbi:MAG: ROK family protein [Hyphomicrobiales bacterium]|nr:ROK family protein [Hyphomicrobiales bacterium]
MRLEGTAVDFGGSKIAAARFEHGRIISHRQVPTSASGDLDAQLAAVGDLLAELGYSGTQPLGVAVTGRLDSDGRWWAVNAQTLEAINGVPLAAKLIERFGRSTRALNDADAAALGEAVYGAGRGIGNVGFITVSTGVGGGFVLGGRLVTSSDGLTGHVGFMTTGGSDIPCGSGRVGTVEAVASGGAIGRAAVDVLGPGATARAVFEHWRDGKDWAVEIVQRSAAEIARLCVNLKTALGLDLVVVGGSVGLAAGYLDIVRDYVSVEPPLFRVNIKPAALGRDSPLFGALEHTMRESRDT